MINMSEVEIDLNILSECFDKKGVNIGAFFILVHTIIIGIAIFGSGCKIIK